MKNILLIMLAMLLIFGCSSKQNSEVLKMKMTSVAFNNGSSIPARHTCDSNNINPALKIIDVPNEAKSLALIVDDPDAPGGMWVHWLLWNIPVDTKEITENAKPGVEGITDFRKPGYGGPCPPPGKAHTYRFKLYALNQMLNLPQMTNKVQLEDAMKGHILAQAELDGTYKRV